MRAVVQIRGEVNQAPDVRDTLEMLNLGRVNHCTFVPDTSSYTGMIAKVNDYVAHGEPTPETVETLLLTRAESADGEDVDDSWVADETDYDDVAGLAEALCGEETTLSEQGIAPVLRLHPPRGGHAGLKQPVATGGEIGKHTTGEIDDLLTAMR